MQFIEYSIYLLIVEDGLDIEINNIYRNLNTMIKNLQNLDLSQMKSDILH